MADQKKTLFIFGLGYVGQHLAHLLSLSGWQIIATTRSPERFARQTEQGWIILPFSSDAPNRDILPYLDRASHLLSTIGPVEGRDPVLAAYERAIKGFAGWTGYLSATSVYPDQPEGWIDEDTAPAPPTARGKTRLLAEQHWQDICQAEIFRIAGIYGPGRNPFAALRAGTARIIDKPGHLFNRIHLSDICQIVQAAMARPRSGRILNLADQQPAPQADVIGFAAHLLGITPPEPIAFDKADLSEMARSFYTAQRKITSKHLETELAYRFSYPDYKAGLTALVPEYGDWR